MKHSKWYLIGGALLCVLMLCLFLQYREREREMPDETEEIARINNTTYPICFI